MIDRTTRKHVRNTLPADLPPEDVANIKALLAARARARRDVYELSTAKIAEKFEVHPSVVRLIMEQTGFDA